MSGLTDAQRCAQVRLLGGVLVAVGGLMTVLCGSCTAYFLGTALWDLSPAGQASTASAEPNAAGWAQVIAVVSIVVGGLPTLLGVLLLLLGVRTIRRAEAGR